MPVVAAIKQIRTERRRRRRERHTHKRAAELLRLVEERLPAEYTATGDHDAWPLIAAALLSRMTMTLRHIIALQPLGRGIARARS